jgi:hypothetical protein
VFQENNIQAQDQKSKAFSKIARIVAFGLQRK